MADQRITQLNPLLAADTQATVDVLPIADVSTAETKKITVAAVVTAGLGEISDNTIPGAKIQTDSITATQIAADAIGASELADSAVDTAAIAAGAVTAAKIAANTITASEIAAGAIGSSELADGAVDTAALQDLAVTTAKIADDAVTAVKIAAGAVGASEIADGSVGASELAADAVTTAKIIDDAVTSAKIAAGAVDATALASDAVTNAKILDGTIAAAKLADDLDGSEFLPQAAQAVLIGPASGADARPTFRVLTAGDVPLLTAANLPVPSGGSIGGVTPGAGLIVDAGGTISINNTIASATSSKVTFDSSGLIINSDALSASDIPSLDTSKITTGTFGSSLIGTKAITGAKLADQSTVLFGGAVDTGGVVTFPTAAFKGQYFYDEINQDLYIWSGSAWLPVTIISGELIYAGTYDASVNQVASVTNAGSAVGLSVGVALPAASSTNNQYYLVVSDSGTGTGNAPPEALAPPDMILSNGAGWDLIDVSSGIGSQIATNVSFAPAGNIIATNVQLAIQELDTEKVAKAGDTMTGNLTLDNASLVFEGSTADDYETTLTAADPTSDHTITLPDQTGTVLVSGNASIVNADISASAEIAVSKLANGTARQLLQTATNGTDVEWTSNVSIPGTLGVTGVATFSTAVSIGAGNLNYSDGTY